MTRPYPDPAGPRPLPLPPVGELLAGAEARLRRQRGYARPLAARGGAALEGALRAARGVLAASLAPAAAWRPVQAHRLGPEAVRLDGVEVSAPRLAQEVAGGAAVGVWLCTLGPCDAGLAARFARDPLGGHVAGDLATQTLFATARAAHGALAALHPGERVLRVALRPRGARLWDVSAVLGLLPLLGAAPLGVTAPEGAGLRPAHSLLGVAVVRPAAP